VYGIKFCLLDSFFSSLSFTLKQHVRDQTSPVFMKSTNIEVNSIRKENNVDGKFIMI
jgi:hypothetical protein